MYSNILWILHSIKVTNCLEIESYKLITSHIPGVGKWRYYKTYLPYILSQWLVWVWVASTIKYHSAHLVALYSYFPSWFRNILHAPLFRSNFAVLVACSKQDLPHVPINKFKVHLLMMKRMQRCRPRIV